MNKLQIEITVDTNDGDYNTAVNDIDEGDLGILYPLIDAIKEFKPYKGKSMGGYESTHHHNYPEGECCRGDMGERTPEEYYSQFDAEVFEVFREYLPWCEYGFHTIGSIYVYPKQAKDKLL